MKQEIVHPTESELFAFLDGELDPAAHRTVEGHHESCAGCSAQLKAWQALFADIAAAPEIALERDLTPAVLAGLASRAALPVRAGRSVRAPTLPVGALPFGALPAVALPVTAPRFLPTLATLQFAAAVAILAFAVPALVGQPAVRAWLSEAKQLLSTAVASWRMDTLLGSLPNALGEVQRQVYGLLERPDALLDTLAALVPVAVSSSLLWLVGNGILIRKYPLSKGQ